MKINRRFNNKILQRLPVKDYEAISPYLKEIKMPLGKLLSGRSESPEDLIFPTSGIVSVLVQSEDDKTSEIAIIGNEGLIGLTIFLGRGKPYASTVVQCEGSAVKLRENHALELFRESKAFREAVLSFLRLIIHQIAQTALCNRHHTLDQQLCRWLLISRDRLSSDLLVMTHGLIANMLGVRREGVSVAAKKLQAAGCITYRRGQITITDRKILMARSCECYQQIKSAYQKEGLD